ncbi:exosortase C-terminal domain/associated protein EpsI [Sphingomonas sp.]|jgi:EpsI family protein|uniref:exosortase C-terminal domain/associated protein EpsI n=1 Tax=Sphingomonas sp. TaxID=28214 RepID=UPI002EDB3703
MTTSAWKLGTPDRRQIVMGGALLAAAATATLLRPVRTTRALSRGAMAAMVPLRIGEYRYASSTGLIVADPNETGETYDQVLTRIYVADGKPPIMLLIAYGGAQDTGLALHRPDACYPSAGYQLSDRETTGLSGVPSGTAVALTAARGDRIEQLYYWTRIGRQFPATAVEQKLAVFAANLRGVLPDGVLVRLSVRSTDRAAAVAGMRTFNEQLVGASGAAGQRILLGGDAAA